MASVSLTGRSVSRSVLSAQHRRRQRGSRGANAIRLMNSYFNTSGDGSARSSAISTNGGFCTSAVALVHMALTEIEISSGEEKEKTSSLS